MKRVLPLAVALLATACGTSPDARAPVALPAEAFENVTRLEAMSQVPRLVERR
jgi:hypothetical protein